ncbi:hypothetical protein PFAG_00356 [Plasmodium falciparum Santa Lucia]|uniref:Uncharacterized protein n=1 Tax=Plasmodium falciparum Santa Lucia TaxID=478859 RepID=W7FPZ5_PLAFA|nr:hypothetical protein PFAG_00356 [Plasmodium falciparum Santa Lucia]
MFKWFNIKSDKINDYDNIKSDKINDYDNIKSDKINDYDNIKSDKINDYDNIKSDKINDYDNIIFFFFEGESSTHYAYEYPLYVIIGKKGCYPSY